MFFQKISNYEFKIQEIQENPNSFEEKSLVTQWNCSYFYLKKSIKTRTDKYNIL